MVLPNHPRARNTRGTEAQAEAEGLANLAAELPPRESGDTLLTPLICVTDQLMFRKMKTDTDPQSIMRPPRPRRFVLLHREYYMAIFCFRFFDRALTV